MAVWMARGGGDPTIGAIEARPPPPRLVPAGPLRVLKRSLIGALPPSRTLGKPGWPLNGDCISPEWFAGA